MLGKKYCVLILISFMLLSILACTKSERGGGLPALTPRVVTEPVKFDTDDPAIWLHPTDPAQSLIIGTDKDENGGLYVFDLNGKIILEKSVLNLSK